MYLYNPYIIVTQIKLTMNITWRLFIDLKYRRENRISIITRKLHAFQLKDYLRTSKLAYTFYGYDTYALYERTNCTWYSYTFRLFTSPEQHRKSSSARYLETNLRSIWLFFCQSVTFASPCLWKIMIRARVSLISRNRFFPCLFPDLERQVGNQCKKIRWTSICEL